MADKTYTERELIGLYSDKARELVGKLTGVQRILAETAVDKFFGEYERRFLGDNPNPEYEKKGDIFANVHKLAKDGRLPPPDELTAKINAFLMEQLGSAIVIGENYGFGIPHTSDSATPNLGLLDRVKFGYKPHEIAGYLDRFVVGQDDAKRTLATAVFYHYNAVRKELEGNPIQGYQKNNILLIGSPAVGKTTLVRRVADLLNVPFGRYDASQFSPMGIVGKDAAGIVREMVLTAKQNKQLAELGIVFVDEFDKLVKGYGVRGFGESYGSDTQSTFLRIMEDEEVDMVPEHHPLHMLGIGSGKIRTKYMLFIMAGAFSGLEEAIAKRVGANTIGFVAGERTANGQASKHNLLLQATHQDLIEYGFLSQLAGRLPIITALHELEPIHLFHILRQAEGNVLGQYQQQIRTATDTNVEFDEGALQEIAERAYRRKTGARGLVTIIEGVLGPLMYELPQRQGVEKLTIRKDHLDNPLQVLEQR